ncbi:hypothetical protein GSU68_14925 [Rathayibacter sp. VKM Ac-2759]|uniref:hypothetical protein n=1 Tax=Rathayibacter sp. VKM Ac-2759 TaxID=2609252 RepID=UPI00131847AC|nr:hypothetical protein [Rathayibacter sp. VKM Ac-2759]QHC67730.1 hypothetical protein GSU68_14925 [Rathayibacter sp. VKM Ac-2759]
MSILSPAPVAVPPSPRAARPPTPGRWPREPGLPALALGLLTLTSAVHPLWALPSVGVGVVGAVLAVAALLQRGERRQGALGLASALLGLAIASVTVPAALGGAVAMLTWFAALRPGGA